MAKKPAKPAAKSKKKRPSRNNTVVIDVPERNIEKQKAIYGCLLCKQIFKDEGLCPNCNVVLKKKAA